MYKTAFVGRKTMGAKRLQSAETHDISDIISDLESNAAISERDLASYIDVADRTIRNWRTAKAEQTSSKLVRLFRIKELVDLALDNSLSKPMIRQLLVTPLDVHDEEQQSIVDIIKEEPDSKFFPQIASLWLENFMVRQSANGHYVLRNEDFDQLAADLEDTKPSDAVKNARSRFLKSR